jgi:hypothetical protein
VEELRPAADAAGCNGGASRHLIPGEWPAADQRITRIFARSHCGHNDPIGQLGWQILEGVHGEVDPSVEQGVVDLFGEESAASDARKRHIGQQVACGVDLDTL